MAECILLLHIVIITKVAQSVQRLHPHMRKDVYTTRQYVVNDALIQCCSQACSKRCYHFLCLNAYH